MDHIVYCEAKIKLIKKLLTGERTMFVRSGDNKKIPHGRIVKGEKVYFLDDSGDNVVQIVATVNGVIERTKMEYGQCAEFVKIYAGKLNLSSEQLKLISNKKCACLIEVKDVEKVKDMKLKKMKVNDDWLIVENIQEILEK